MLKQSGAPNPCFGAAVSSSLSCSTWNARGLFAKAGKSRQFKLRHAANVVGKADFAGFQEVHGSSAEMLDYFHTFGEDRHVSWSAFDCKEAASLDSLPIRLGSSSGTAPSKKDFSNEDSKCNNIFCASSGVFARSGSSDNHDGAVEFDLQTGHDGKEASVDTSGASSYSSCDSDGSDSSTSSNISQSCSTDESSCSASVGGAVNVLSRKAFPKHIISKSHDSARQVSGDNCRTWREHSGFY